MGWEAEEENRAYRFVFSCYMGRQMRAKRPDALTLAMFWRGALAAFDSLGSAWWSMVVFGGEARKKGKGDERGWGVSLQPRPNDSAPNKEPRSNSAFLATEKQHVALCPSRVCFLIPSFSLVLAKMCTTARSMHAQKSSCPHRKIKAAQTYMRRPFLPM